MFELDSKFLRHSSEIEHSSQITTPKASQIEQSLLSSSNDKTQNNKLKKRLEHKQQIIEEMQAVQDELYKNLDVLQEKYDEAQSKIQKLESQLQNIKEDRRLDSVEITNRQEETLSRLLKEKLIEKETEIIELKNKAEEALESKNDTYEHQSEIMDKFNESNIYLKRENESLSDELQRLYRRIPEIEELNRLQEQVKEFQLIINGFRHPDKSRYDDSFSQPNSRIMDLLFEKFKTSNLSEIQLRILQLNPDAQTFAEKVTNMIVKFSPPGTFSDRPAYKHVWKCLVRLFEEYMNIKQHNFVSPKAPKDLIPKILDLLGVSDIREISPAIYALKEDSLSLRDILQKL